MRVRCRTALLVGLLIAFATTEVCADGSTGDLLIRALRSIDFSRFIASLHDEGELLGIPAADIVPMILSHATALDDQENEMALLAIAREHADGLSSAVVLGLVRAASSFRDWTLTAVVLDMASSRDLATVANVLPVADRMEEALGADVGLAGYERAAISLAVASVVAARQDPGGATVLAESLRSIARLSRSESVVGACSDAAREIVTLQAP